MGSAGGSSSNTDSRFARQGGGSVTASNSVPSDLLSMLATAREQIALPGTDVHTDLITTLLTRNNETVPGKSQLEAYLDIDPDSYAFYNQLITTATQDPYSGTYEANTQAAYVQRVKTLMASLDSQSFRMGYNHQGLAKGEALARVNEDRSVDLAKQRAVDVQAQLGATNALLTLEQLVSGRKTQVAEYLQRAKTANEQSSLRAGDQRTNRSTAQMAITALEANLRSSQIRESTEDITGWGSQVTDGKNFQAGVSCCFILLEALNGTLPWYVRVGRAEFCTPKRMRGYRRMASWLVPSMRRSRFVTSLVNATMVRPFLRRGAHYYKAKSAKPTGRFYDPVCRAWFAIWDKMGQ